MRTALVLTLTTLFLVSFQPASAETRCFEMRTYYAAEGKLPALEARFRDHTCKLFEKHGMQNIGYWTPLDNPENKLIYILAFPNRDARDKSWKEFVADPDWKQAQKESEKDGPLVTKVESLFLTATDYSPEIRVAKDGPRVFQLRIYTPTPGKLDNLQARFRNHTTKLFNKHGMMQIGYWTASDPKQGTDTLVYILAHKSKEAGEAAFKAFREDPDWIAAKTASEEKAGGPLTVKDGVKSIYLNATDFSPMQ